MQDDYRPENVMDFADFKCSDNLYWRDRWPDGVRQYCCDEEQLCEDSQMVYAADARPSVLSSQGDWVEELSSPQLPDAVVRRYDLSMLKDKVLAAEAQHTRDLQIAFGLGCFCLIAGLVLSVARSSGSSTETLPRYDVVPQAL